MSPSAARATSVSSLHSRLPGSSVTRGTRGTREFDEPTPNRCQNGPRHDPLLVAAESPERLDQRAQTGQQLAALRTVPNVAFNPLTLARSELPVQILRRVRGNPAVVAHELEASRPGHHRCEPYAPG